MRTDRYDVRLYEEETRLRATLVVDASGSINTTSAGKTNFWSNVLDLFGASVPVDAGLAGKNMPGPGNVAQPMSYDKTAQWFIAAGASTFPRIASCAG